MSTNLNELDPESPEYEEAIRKAQEAEDRAIGNEEPKGDSDPASEDVDPPSDDPDPELDEPKQAEATDPDKPKDEPAQAEPAAGKKPGIVSKDGQSVLPYGALKGARKEAQQARQRAEAAEAENAKLQQQIADMKAGKKPEGMDDEALEELANDFPTVRPLVDEHRKLRERVNAAPPPPAPAPAADAGDDPVQEAIDSIPTLLDWQVSDPEKFQLAVEHDNVLAKSPAWKGKTYAERFVEATRRAARDAGVQIEEQQEDDAPSRNAQPAKRKDPAEVVKEAPRRVPNTLSDLKGGNTQGHDDLRRASATKQLASVQDMSDAEIDEWLRKTGGG